MSQPFLGEIRVFSFNFAPPGWAVCNGQLMPIAQNTPLFSVLGTFYGGDGESTFALPNLMGSAPVSQGAGPNLTDYVPGQTAGAAMVELLESEIPQHAHTARVSSSPAELQAPASDRALARSSPGFAYQSGTANLAQAAPEAITPQGGSVPHNNLPPLLVMNFCIALTGVFPPRQ